MPEIWPDIEHHVQRIRQCYGIGNEGLIFCKRGEIFSNVFMRFPQYKESRAPTKVKPVMCKTS